MRKMSANKNRPNSTMGAATVAGTAEDRALVNWGCVDKVEELAIVILLRGELRGQFDWMIAFRHWLLIITVISLHPTNFIVTYSHNEPCTTICPNTVSLCDQRDARVA